jgi:hypothetical protein
LKLTGVPVAQASYATRFRAGHVQVFPVRRESYPDEAAQAFEEEILPRIRDWLEAQYMAPETAPEERAEFFVTWLGNEHEIRMWKLRKS